MSAARSNRHVLCAGLTTFDVVQFYRERPAWGAKGTAVDSYADVGGPAANAAITVALLGGRVRLATAIGSGVVPELVRSRLAQLGVTAIDLAAESTQLPVSSIWVDLASGSRTVISTNRAGAEPGPAAEVVEERTAAVLVDGHHPAMCERIVEQASALGIPIVLDGGSWKPVLERVLPRVSVAILSADFALPDVRLQALEQARLVRDRFGVREVAITRGPEPLLALSEGEELEIPVPRVDAVDTLAAGDVLHGAYLYFRYLAGVAHADALRRAAQVASESCAHLGARRGAEIFARRGT